jgi:hypothetical protein
VPVPEQALAEVGTEEAGAAGDYASAHGAILAGGLAWTFFRFWLQFPSFRFEESVQMGGENRSAHT